MQKDLAKMTGGLAAVLAISLFTMGIISAKTSPSAAAVDVEPNRLGGGILFPDRAKVVLSHLRRGAPKPELVAEEAGRQHQASEGAALGVGNLADAAGIERRRAAGATELDRIDDIGSVHREDAIGRAPGGDHY